jgi:MOSC domain-containing protein YiiM
MHAAGRILSIQAGKVAPLRPQAGGEVLAVRSAIAKTVISSLATPQVVASTRLGLSGDEQADPEVHGGIEKAVYVYPAAHYAHWQHFLDRPQGLPHGSLGENLTVEGLTEADLWLGDTLQIGSCTFIVTQPRRPCHKLASWLGSPRVGREMLLRGITGWYLAVETPGEIRAGDLIEVLPGTRQVTLAERVRQMTRRVDLD